MKRTRVKICCISSLEEARNAIAAGADAIGLVGEMPSGQGIIDDDLAREIASVVPPPIETFLLTSRDNGAAIADHVEYCRATSVQIVRHIDPGEYATIIDRLPATRRVQVIHVEGQDALELIERYEPFVHAFLLDSGRPNAPLVELGGTGRTHDWSVSERFVRRTIKPVFLAGGLKSENVKAAIEAVKPFAVDLCSGVRTDGHLDGDKVRRFMAAVTQAQTHRP